MNPAIREYLKSNNITICKTSASTTEIKQELDAYNFFKAPKKRLASIINDDCIKKYPYLKKI